MASRSRRTRAELVPTHTDGTAHQALTHIRALRRAARDPDLPQLPDRLVDGDDLETVLRWLETHPRPTCRAAELPHRAVLVQYQQQQATARWEKRVLAILDTGHEVRASPARYGTPLGLPTSQACWNRRRDLTVKYREYGQARPTARDTAHAGELADWLTRRHARITAVAEMLIDHRDTLLALVPAHRREDLAEAIDTAGAGLSRHPAAGVVAAITYAVFLLDDCAVEDTVIRDGLLDAAGLRGEYRAIQEGVA